MMKAFLLLIIIFYNSLKNKEWKEKRDRTAEMMQTLFKAEFAIKKRFP